jgi:hypothetical protein
MADLGVRGLRAKLPDAQWAFCLGCSQLRKMEEEEMIRNFTPAKRVFHTVLTAFGNQCQACEHEDPTLMAQGFIKENWGRMEAMFKYPPVDLSAPQAGKSIEKIESALAAMDEHIQAAPEGDSDSQMHLAIACAPKLVWAIREAVAGLVHASEQTGETDYGNYLRAVAEHLDEIGGGDEARSAPEASEGSK